MLFRLWQVSGRWEADFESYRRLDLYDVDNWSLTHDLKILLRTVVVVLAGAGHSSRRRAGACGGLARCVRCALPQGTLPFDQR